MATQIVILNESRVLVDDSFGIDWADKGKNWVDTWLPNTIHAVLWNNLIGQNEIQNKDASTGDMTGNTNLNATSDAVGTTTVANLLTWGETRKGQIETATTDYDTALYAARTKWITDGHTHGTFHENNSATDSYWDWSKTWRDYDPNHS
jgi:hypothetical protein|tara:strand:+ start:547 stop:993 length:447 start_codon:yes stop_codon:yes gene_type:complete